MLIFVHIPKTAGTTFKNLLVNAGIKYNEVIDILTQRMKKYHNIEWKKEKYDFLSY